MKNLFEKLKKSTVARRVTSAFMAVVLSIGAVFCIDYIKNGETGEIVASAATSNKEYMEFVCDRIAAGLQEKFTILEIVPYEPFGEFRYYVGDKNVKAGLEANQDLLKQYYTGTGHYLSNGQWTGAGEWFKINTTFSNFDFYIRYNTYDQKFEVKPGENFYKNVVPYYDGILDGKVEVKTVEANDLKTEDIQNADLVIISTAIHDSNTVECYKAFTGINENKCLDKNGNTVGDGKTCTYDNYEKVSNPDGTTAIVSRDISWDMAAELLDYLLIPKEMLKTDGDTIKVRVPMIMDNQKYSELKKDSNMYKVITLLRMLNTDMYNFMKGYLSTTYTEGTVVNEYKNDNGITTVALDMTVTGQFDSTSLISWKNSNTEITDQYSENDIFKFIKKAKEMGKDVPGVEEFETTKPTMTPALTDNYYLFNGDSSLIPSNVGNMYNCSYYPGFVDRLGTQTSTEGILKYLLGEKDSQIKRTDRKIKVLEVQPCNDYTYTNYDSIIKLADKLRFETDKITESNYQDYISVDHVTTNKLNGMTDDLIGKYDLIIIGENTGILTKENGRTIYNDRSLDGYVYLAFGDLVKCSTSLMGWLPEDYVKVSSSGQDAVFKFDTDLSALKKRYSSYNVNGGYIGNNHSGHQNLIKFDHLIALNENTKIMWTPYVYNSLIKQGSGNYYVLKAVYENLNSKYNNNVTGFFNDRLGNVRSASNDITEKTKDKLLDFAKSGKAVILSEALYTPDPTKVYTTSIMYDFAKTVTGGGYAYVKEDKVSLAARYLDNSVPEITMTKTPTPLSYNSEGYVNKFNDHNMNFAFNITGRPASKYKIQLLVDKNGDGIFRDVNEGILDDSNEVYYTGFVTTDGEGNASYSIESCLSDDYVGLLAWKIKVMLVGDDGVETKIASSEVGYSAIKSAASEKRDIKILQITPVRQYYGGSNEITLHLKSDTNFLNCIKKIEDNVGYHMIIDEMSSVDYEKLFQSKPYNKADKETDRLKYYDMIVIGFADLYQFDDIGNANGAVDNLIDFINEGKSVLLAHDTVAYNATQNYFMAQEDGGKIYSFTGNYYNQSTYTAQKKVGGDRLSTNISILLRNIIGMDKYGVTLNPEDREGKNKPSYDIKAGKPSYTAASEDGNCYVEEIQGYNPWIIYRKAEMANYSTARNGNNLLTLVPYNDTGYFAMENNNFTRLWLTNKVDKLNEGQLTMYPYEIPDNLKVATTHSQYFELDMEDKDMVVWYTLADDSGTFSDHYKYTAGDAANNYYIYSKGNITYSGAGHSYMSETGELELFVNTFVKAITGGNNEPELTITNASKGAGDMDVLYVNSADLPAEYEIDILGTDRDLVSPESVGYDKNTGENEAYVGEFKRASVYWINRDGQEQLIMEYGSGNRPLKTGIVRELKLGDCVAAGTMSQSDLEYIANCVSGEEGYGYADFKVVIEDSVGATDEASIRMLKRDLFNLE